MIDCPSCEILTIDQKPYSIANPKPHEIIKVICLNGHYLIIHAHKDCEYCERLEK